MKEKLVQEIKTYCNCCNKETTYELIGTQNCSQGRYLLYNCQECSATHTLSSLFRIDKEHKEMEKFFKQIERVNLTNHPDIATEINRDLFHEKFRG